MIAAIKSKIKYPKGAFDVGYLIMSYVIYLYAFKKNKLGYAAAYSVIFFILVGIFTAVLFKTQKEQIFGEGE